MALFNENMTRVEALKALFSACEGKDNEEKEQIFKEYETVSRSIIQHELDDNDGCLTSYVI